MQNNIVLNYWYLIFSKHFEFNYYNYIFNDHNIIISVNEINKYINNNMYT